jgi:hypothetical protein
LREAEEQADRQRNRIEREILMGLLESELTRKIEHVRMEVSQTRRGEREGRRNVDACANAAG